MSVRLCLSRYLFSSVLCTLAGLLLNASTVHAGTVFSIPATSCAAINPNQARRLEWRKEGVISRDESQSLWVMCPLIRESGENADGDAFAYFSAAVSIFRDASAAQDASVRCILREWVEDQETQRSDVNVSFATGDLQTLSWFALRPAQPGYSIYNLACRLDHDTGVSAIHTESHTTSSSSLRDALP